MLVFTTYDLGGSITLSWLKSEDDGAGLNNVSAYTIYRYSAANGDVAPLASVQSGTTEFKDNTTTDTETYYYFIKSYDNQCNSVSESSNVARGQSVNNLTTLPEVISALSFNSLTSKAQNAIAAFDRGDRDAAINLLNALLKEIAAQSGNKIDTNAANMLTTYVTTLINNIR